MRTSERCGGPAWDPLLPVQSADIVRRGKAIANHRQSQTAIHWPVAQSGVVHNLQIRGAGAGGHSVADGSAPQRHTARARRSVPTQSERATTPSSTRAATTWQDTAAGGDGRGGVNRGAARCEGHGGRRHCRLLRPPLFGSPEACSAMRTQRRGHARARAKRQHVQRALGARAGAPPLPCAVEVSELLAPRAALSWPAHVKPPRLRACFE